MIFSAVQSLNSAPLSKALPSARSFSLLLKHLLAAYLCIVACSSIADAPFTVSTDRLEVTDAKTGLVWRRCAEGMVASLTGCTGTATRFTHVAAMMHASSQSGGWRLPNVQELSSIADLSRQLPSIDIVAFPSTTLGYFWSSTPDATTSQAVWLVDFNEGGVFSNYRDNTNYVRLVRAGQ